MSSEPSRNIAWRKFINGVAAVSLAAGSGVAPRTNYIENEAPLQPSQSTRTAPQISYVKNERLSLQPVQPQGTLMLIGGGPIIDDEAMTELAEKYHCSTDEVKRDHKDEWRDQCDWSGHFRKMMELASAKDPTKGIVVECITSTHHDPMRVGKEYVDFFKLLGASEKSGFITLSNPADANDPAIKERIERADIVFFCEGDQKRGATSILGGEGRTGSLVYDALKKRYASDARSITAGTSAGAMLMSDPMIYEDRTVKGLGFMPPIDDTHVDSRHRLPRLTDAAMRWKRIGIGIDKSTALVIKNGKALVIGAQGLPPLPDGKPDIRYVHVVDQLGQVKKYGPGESFDLSSQMDILMPQVAKTAAVGG